jgi:DDE domain
MACPTGMLRSCWPSAVSLSITSVVYRWVQRFTPELIEAARPGRPALGDRWFAGETYLKVAGTWACLYRAVDRHGQVVDVLLSAKRDLAAARRFFTRALRAGTVPAEVTTDRAPAYPRVLDELVPSAVHTIEQYANNPSEADHGRLKARIRPMRGLTHGIAQRGSSPPPRLRAESAPRPLRHSHRRPRRPQAPHRLRRLGNQRMTSGGFELPDLTVHGDGITQQCGFGRCCRTPRP